MEIAFDVNLLMKLYNDLNWVDDVADYKCQRCLRVLIEHYIANCGHKFCANCKRVQDDGSERWRCPQCHQFIREIGEQDFEFRDKVFELRTHCPNQKYGCQNIFKLKKLNEHLKECEYTRERALPVLYEGHIVSEESILLLQLKNEVIEMKQKMMDMEMREREREREVELEKDGRTKYIWDLSVEVNQLLNKTNKVEENKISLVNNLQILNVEVNGLRSDLLVNTTRLNNEIMDIKAKLPLKNKALDVEEIKSKISKLEGKSDALFEMVELNIRKNYELMLQSKIGIENELKVKESKIQSEINSIKIALKEDLQQMSTMCTKSKEELDQIVKEIKKEELEWKINQEKKCAEIIDRVNGVSKDLQTTTTNIEMVVENRKEEVITFVQGEMNSISLALKEDLQQMSTLCTKSKEELDQTVKEMKKEELEWKFNQEKKYAEINDMVNGVSKDLQTTTTNIEMVVENRKEEVITFVQSEINSALKEKSNSKTIMRINKVEDSIKDLTLHNNNCQLSIKGIDENNKQMKDQLISIEANITKLNKKELVTKLSVGKSTDFAYNILLLGEIGVGKSTFINAFCNYLKYNSLNEATQKSPEVLIPCSFTVSDDNFEQRIVRCGHDSNENFQAATQHCKCHIFEKGDLRFRLIDTPGIGDTRGIDQDNINLEGMMDYLTQYEHLHAICILLKPNESRLTPSFEFRLKQLLCQLHHSAKQNILFLFTNSRSTLYRPGDTVKPLTELINKIKSEPSNPVIPFNKSNTFCLDNEAFRIFVAVHQGMNFSPSEYKNFEESWKRSLEESNRLIKYIVEGATGEGMVPHLVIDSLAINYTKQVIVDLSQPLADIVQLIQYNLLVLNDNNVVNETNAKIKRYEQARDELTKYTATFAIYLKQNAMIVSNDAYKEYLQVLIGRQQSLNEIGSNKEAIINGLKQMLVSYEQEKKVIDDAVRNSYGRRKITLQEIIKIFNELANMNAVGEIFQKFIIVQKKIKKFREILSYS